MLESRVEDAFPRAFIDETFTALFTEAATRAFWKRLPRKAIVADLKKLRHSGLTLGEVIGPEGAKRLREGAARPWKPNRELAERLLDQPVLRQALRNMVQKTFQQFLSQINPLGGQPNQPGRGSVLGAIGRGIASRAEKAAQIGKTFMEGFGGGLYQQVESQLQPFLTAFMSRSVQLLTEGLFEGEQSKLAAEARVQGLETLLATPLETLLPEPDPDNLHHQLETHAEVAAHIVSLPGYQKAVQGIIDTLYDRARDKTLREVLTKLDVSAEAQPAFLMAFGELGYHYLALPAVKDWLQAEIEAVW